MARYIDVDKVDSLLGDKYQELMILSLQEENKLQKYIAQGINFQKILSMMILNPKM